MKIIQNSLCVTLLLSCLSCNEKQASVQPEIKNISESVYASGIIKSKNQYQVYSKVSGLLKTIYVKEGDRVKKGDKLFQLHDDNVHLSTDNARLQAAYSDYNANLGKLEDLRNAIALGRKKLSIDSLLYIRQLHLWENNIGSKVDLEQKEINFENSKTALMNALFRYDDLQKQLQFSSSQSRNNLMISKTNENDFLIKSEVDGVVYKIYREQNELVTSQSPVAVIGDVSEFIVELNIDEKDIVKIKTGQQVLVRMDSYKGEIFEAAVSSIDPILNERTRTFNGEAIFINKPPVLYPNLTAETNIVIQTKASALTIPRNYLVNDSMVMLEDGTLKKITTGLKDYNLVEITEGLTGSSKITLPEK